MLLQKLQVFLSATFLIPPVIIAYLNFFISGKRNLLIIFIRIIRPSLQVLVSGFLILYLSMSTASQIFHSFMVGAFWTNDLIFIFFIALACNSYFFQFCFMLILCFGMLFVGYGASNLCFTP